MTSGKLNKDHVFHTTLEEASARLAASLKLRSLGVRMVPEDTELAMAKIRALPKSGRTAAPDSDRDDESQRPRPSPPD